MGIAWYTPSSDTAELWTVAKSTSRCNIPASKRSWCAEKGRHPCSHWREWTEGGLFSNANFWLFSNARFWSLSNAAWFISQRAKAVPLDIWSACFWVSWFPDFLVSGFSWFLGFWVSGFLGSCSVGLWVSGFLGFRVSWFLGFWASGFLGFWFSVVFLSFLDFRLFVRSWVAWFLGF